ncbi:hypothetical protein LMG667_17430 [Xanthomonas euvesicatoria]|uniref:hypothetical protein n=1 Tax=Xanthomonas euvesicatoria TaxID=456327 RepID=UPI00080EAE7D|nr:hypothetical protein [Xanthomonas euvesicatoria]OCG83442.1 hypothetical protein LMG667_17430 [Xanthomonas euvesicatoria]
MHHHFSDFTIWQHFFAATQITGFLGICVIFFFSVCLMAAQAVMDLLDVAFGDDEPPRQAPVAPKNVSEAPERTVQECEPPSQG